MNRTALKKILAEEGLTAAERIQAGDFVRDTSRKGLTALRVFRVIRLGVGQALITKDLLGTSRDGERVLLPSLVKVQPTYRQLLGHAYGDIADRLAHRMETQGLSFEKASRGMTSWHRARVSPEVEQVIREMVEGGHDVDDIRR